MTEAEWLKSKDPIAMGKAVARRKRASARVLRMCCVLFWSWQANRLRSKNDQTALRNAVAILEQWAETGTEPTNLRQLVHIFFTKRPSTAFLRTLNTPVGWTGKYGTDANKRLVWALRELFGNPFAKRTRKTDPYRGWAFDPNWRTDTVLALANRIYDAREFETLPILADALQDAGCVNDDILSHCREPGEHARGCWVVDLVLGKT